MQAQRVPNVSMRNDSQTHLQFGQRLEHESADNAGFERNDIAKVSPHLLELDPAHHSHNVGAEEADRWCYRAELSALPA